MAFVNIELDRKVVPNWRPFQETSYLGELSFCYAPSGNYHYPIEEYINSWRENRHILFASELLSAAVSNDQLNNDIVKDAASYIIQNKNIANSAQIELAETILESPEIENVEIGIDKILEKLSQIQDIQIKIKQLKYEINKFPYNPILYVEIARNYIMLGQNDKAILNMNIALHLAPNNRYVTRSAVRMYIHLDDMELAHNVITSNSTFKYDPWLLAPEISLKLMMNKSSNFIKQARNLLNQDVSPFYITELASSLGTLEYYYGGKRKSRDLFCQSLIMPNDNSLAQAEWAFLKQIPIRIKRETVESVKRNHEAQSLYSYYVGDYNRALEETVDWLSDSPFSEEATLRGSSIAYNFLKKYDIAARILNIGLKAHPGDPVFLNNLAYTLALDNKVDEAQKRMDELQRISRFDMDESTAVCMKATQGLIAYRKGKIEDGRRLYLEAINDSKELKDYREEYNWKAILNYFREELRIADDIPDNVMSIIDGINERPDMKEITKMKEDIKHMILIKVNSKS